MFEIYEKALYYVKTPGIYYKSSGMKCLYHVSVADYTIPFWLEVLLSIEMLQWVNYNGCQEIAGGHPGFTSVFRNIFRLSPGEVVEDDEHLEFWQEANGKAGAEEHHPHDGFDGLFFEAGKDGSETFCEHIIDCHGLSTDCKALKYFLDVIMMFDAWRNKCQASWKRSPPSCWNKHQTCLALKSWWRPFMSSWKQCKTEVWEMVCPAGGSTWIAMYPDVSWACDVLSFCSTQDIPLV